eukprot:13622601-Alexandrium_andersonii.AAC.2
MHHVHGQLGLRLHEHLFLGSEGPTELGRHQVGLGTVLQPEVLAVLPEDHGRSQVVALPRAALLVRVPAVEVDAHAHLDVPHRT